MAGNDKRSHLKRSIELSRPTGVCDHWECDMVECVRKTQSQSQTPSVEERNPAAPLHLQQSRLPSTISTPGTTQKLILRAPPPSEENTFKSPPSPSSVHQAPDMNRQNRGSNQCSSTRVSVASSLSNPSSEFLLTQHQRLFASPSLHEKKTVESTTCEEEMTERTVEEQSVSSGLSISTEFKITVQNKVLTDNTNQKGNYTGAMDRRNQNPHGKGTMVYPDAIYEGQWVNGDWCGFGTLTEIATGIVYQGGFFDNMKHGLGVMKYPDGRVYDGMFSLGKLEGKGRLMESDGTKFWGYWGKEGIPHGRGKKEYPDGRVYDGEFDQGTISGHGKMTYPNGTWYLGEWCDGLPNGLGIEVNKSGKLLYEGMYASGEQIKGSSMPRECKSNGQFLLYRSSVKTASGGGTLVGPLPRQVTMRHRMDWAVKNL